MKKKTHAHKRTHAHPATTQKRIQHIKRPHVAVVGTEKKSIHTHTHTQIQHRNAYTIPNDYMKWSLRQKKRKSHNTYTHNNTYNHTPYQTTAGCGSWKKNNTHTCTYTHNNPETHTPYQTTAGCGRWDKTKKHTRSHTHTQQHITAYIIPNDRRRRSLGQNTKKKQKKQTYTHTQQQHRHAYIISNDRRRRSFGQKKK